VPVTTLVAAAGSSHCEVSTWNLAPAAAVVDESSGVAPWFDPQAVIAKAAATTPTRGRARFAREPNLNMGAFLGTDARVGSL
jgi:hypothetical protein